LIVEGNLQNANSPQVQEAVQLLGNPEALVSAIAKVGVDALVGLNCFVALDPWYVFSLFIAIYPFLMKPHLVLSRLPAAATMLSVCSFI
jgi:hypothetical protein